MLKRLRQWVSETLDAAAELVTASDRPQPVPVRVETDDEDLRHRTR